MKTIIKKIDEKNWSDIQLNTEELDQAILSQATLDQAGEILRNGGLVAFPTETVYGLGADALSEDAAKKTYQAKGRPSDNPLIVHIADLCDLDALVEEVPLMAKQIAEKFWPGPLTMVFHKSKKVPYGTTGGLDTVAVRMPDHALARAIIRAGGGYVSAPSANSSGKPSPTDASHVAEDLSGKIDMIVDGGPVVIGVESTIVDMTAEVPMILRPGAITQEMLQEVIGRVEVDKAIVDANSGEAPKAPGMKYRHYAPKAELTIVDGEQKQVVAFVNALAKEARARGECVGVIGTDESMEGYQCDVVKSVGSRQDEATIAHNLYKVLREFDEEKVDCIYSESFYGNPMSEAIMNRLLKAAGQKIIKAEE